MKLFRLLLPLFAAAFLNLLLASVLHATVGLPMPAGLALCLAATALLSRVQLPQGALRAISTLPNIAWGDGSDNMGGLRTIAYYALHSEFAAGGHPAPAARDAATNLNDLSTITTAPTFTAGKGWKRFYITEDTGMVDSTLQGEKDGRSWLNTFKGLHPGNQEQLLGLFRYIVNAGMYWLGDDAEGSKRLVGSEFYPAKLDTASITTTETAAGRKGTTFEFKCSSPYPAPIVKFELDEESGSGSGA